MSEHVRAERERIERLLGAEAGALAGLDGLGAVELTALRRRLSHALSEHDGAVLDRLVTLGEKLPGPLAASLAQRLLGARLGARAVERMRPESALGLAGRVSPDFLADLAFTLDPDRVGEALDAADPRLLGDVAEVLAERGDWTTMGGALDRLSAEHVLVARSRVGEEGVARALARCHDPERIERILGAMSGHTG